MKKCLTALLLFLLVSKVDADECTLKLHGRVLDHHDKSALDDANVFILETGKGAATDSMGYYVLENLCAGKYHFIISHLGCNNDTQYLEINSSRSQDFYLEHHWEELQEIVSTAASFKAASTTLINKDELSKNSGKDLGEILKSLNGVNLIKSGNNINKPIVHGMYGSRISIVRNNSKLESQDWGMEHAPELNPYDAEIVSINNDLSGIRFSTTALNGNIEIQSSKYKYHKFLKTDVLYALQSNNLKNTLSAQVQQGFDKGVAYKVSGLFSINGDAHAPNYVLSNTASREGNVSTGVSLLKKGWRTTVDYTYFYQQLGILRSAHIGNITDLLAAIQAEKPIIINPYTFTIQNPKQTINHHTFNVELSKTYKQHEFIFRYYFQLDKRKEFDIRRGGRSDIPALDMRLRVEQYNVIHKYSKTTKKSILVDLENGITINYKYNSNNYETQIKPLIPDYLYYGANAYSLNSFSYKVFKWQVAARYEYVRFLPSIYDASNTLQKPIYNFNNYAAGLYFYYSHPKNYICINSSFTANSRNPNPGELFSNGLHHGAAVIEYGNQNLSNEHNLKYNLGIALNYKKYIQIEISPYVNYSKNYIYYYPLGYPVLTIRGAFPAFRFTNTDALLYGTDISVSGNFYKYFTLWLKSSLIRGKNLLADDNIIYMPSDLLKSGLDLNVDLKNDNQFFASISTETVFKQRRIPQQIIDYKETPPTYTLLNMQAGYTYSFKSKNKLRFSLGVENVTNRNYRNYLNRFRYYADEVGWNMTLRIHYTFNN